MILLGEVFSRRPKKTLPLAGILKEPWNLRRTSSLPFLSTFQSFFLEVSKAHDDNRVVYRLTFWSNSVVNCRFLMLLQSCIDYSVVYLQTFWSSRDVVQLLTASWSILWRSCRPHCRFSFLINNFFPSASWIDVAVRVTSLVQYYNDVAIVNDVRWSGSLTKFRLRGTLAGQVV